MEQEEPEKFFFSTGPGWHSVTSVKLGMVIPDITEPQMNGYWPGFLELGKDFTIHIQPDFKTYLKSNASPSLRAQITRLISLADKKWSKLPMDLSICEGQIFELISPKDHFRQELCPDPGVLREQLQEAFESGRSTYLITRLCSFCDARFVKRKETDRGVSDAGANNNNKISLGSIVEAVTAIADSDTLTPCKTTRKLIESKGEEWGLIEGGPQAGEFPIYALSYRKVLLKVTKVSSETDFVPADNRWKMSTTTTTTTTEAELDDGFLIREADIEDTDREAEICEDDDPYMDLEETEYDADDDDDDNEFPRRVRVSWACMPPRG